MSKNEQNGNPVDGSTPKNITNTKSFNNKNQNCTKIGMFPLISSIFLFLYEIANIVLYFIMICSKEDIEKNTVLLAYHSLFHICVILLTISLFLTAFKKIINGHDFFISIISSILVLLTFVFYMIYSGVFFVETKDPKNQITIEKLQNKLKSAPIEKAFFYSKGLIKSKDFTANPTTGQATKTSKYVKCYSNSSILLPLNSFQINERYDFVNAPKYFYFQIIQELNMSDDFQYQFNKTISKIKLCNKDEIKIKFLPLLNRTFIVGNPKMPIFLTHDARMVAGFAGFGLYYDLYSKSISSFIYIQKVKIEVNPNFDYDKMWAWKWCKSYGKCSPLNQKPRPNTEDL